MSFSLDSNRMTRLHEEEARLKYALAASATAIAASAAAVADTEDELASTFERMARDQPQHAERLQGKAAEARRFAALERERAHRYDPG